MDRGGKPVSAVKAVYSFLKGNPLHQPSRPPGPLWWAQG